MPKTIKQQDALLILANVPEEKLFWCNDGRIFKNMRELNDGLASMTEATFSYHVNKEKNDFANWVRDVIKDGELAKNISKATNRVQAARVVASRVAILERISNTTR